MHTSETQFYVILTLGSITIIVTAIISLVKAIIGHRIKKQENPSTNVKHDWMLFFCSVAGAILLFFNGCNAHQNVIKSKQEAQIKDSIKSYADSLYKNLVTQKIDTGKNLITKNIDLTTQSKDLIGNVQKLQQASKELISKVDMRTRKGIDSIIAVASQSPQERLVNFYANEVIIASQVQEVILFFNNKQTISNLSGDSLQMLSTIDSLDKKFKTVNPKNDLFKADKRIDINWQQCLQYLQSAKTLIKSGLHDLNDPNPLSRERGNSMEKISALSLYQAEISNRLININSYISARLKNDKTMGSVRGTYDFNTPDYIPEN